MVGWAKVKKEDAIETYVSACWMQDCEEGWIPISDQPAGKRRVNEYDCACVSVKLPGQQKSWMEPGSQFSQGRSTFGPFAVGTLFGDVVGQSFGRLLHASWQT